MSNSPLVSVIVSPLSLDEKLMVSPLVAAAISARSEPVPLSLLLVTVKLLSNVRSSIRSTRGRKCLRRRRTPRRGSAPRIELRAGLYSTDSLTAT